MPLTPAHVAAIVPLARRRSFLLSPLVVGSMAPDLEYWLRQTPTGLYGHTLPGLFWFCVPVGFLALLLWHAVLKRPLVLLLPDWMSARLWSIAGPFAWSPPKRVLHTAALVLLGAITHVAWDAFTHPHGVAVQVILPLQAVLLLVGDHELRVFKLLQHLSTVVGLGLLGYWSMRWLARAEPDPEAPRSSVKRRVITLSLAFFAAVACATLAVVIDMTSSVGDDPFHQLRRAAGRVVISGSSGILIVLAAYAVILPVPATQRPHS